MTLRTVLLGAALAALAITGCSLDRAGVGARDASAGFDAGVGIDASGPCTAGSCDDGEPCTDDRCDPSAGCVHEPNTAACDDEVLCNGGDTCGGGTCSVHDMVDPCPGASTCDAATDACVGCVTDADCPGPVTGDYSACTFTSVCTTTGERSRTVTTYSCGAEGECVPAETVETDTGGCPRNTDGAACGAPTPGAWGPCGGFDDACDLTGTQSRSVSSPICSAGACGVQTSVEMMACARDTNGMPCGGGEVCGAYSACAQSTMSSCDPAGTQSRTCRSPACASGICGPGVARTDSRACTVTVTGLPCTTARTCDACRENASGRCDPGDPGTRTCNGPTGMCGMDGTCATIPTTENCTCPG